jgi:hypothetical protein
VFEAVEALDEAALHGDGSEIRAVFADVLKNYPQLRLPA